MQSRTFIGALIAAMCFLSGCKVDGNSAESPVSTDSLPSSSLTGPAANKSESCNISQVDGGSKIVCGDNNAFIPNPTEPVKPKFPVLLDGNSSHDPSTPDHLVGDRLVSVTKNNNAELITIWIEKENAVLQYENGVIYPRDTPVFYNSGDCSGDGAYQTNPDTSSANLGMGDRIIYWDRYYRLGNAPVHCYPRSKKEKDGTCTTLSGSMMSDFNGFVAKPANPGVTTLLYPGYRVKVQ